jgi:hypothetical protein
MGDSPFANGFIKVVRLEGHEKRPKPPLNLIVYLIRNAQATTAKRATPSTKAAVRIMFVIILLEASG